MRIDLEFFCEIRNNALFYYCPYIIRSIEKYGRGSELAKYVALKYFPNAYFLEVIKKQWKDEDLMVVSTDYGAALKDLLASNPPALSKKEAEHAGWVMNGLPNKEPFLGIRASVKQAMMKAFPTSGTSTNAQSKYIGWNSSDMVRSRSWVVTLGERSVQHPPATNVMIYSEYLGRLHADFDDKRPITHEIAQIYCQFAIVFYRGGRYDLAEPLLEQIVLWRDDKGRPPEKRVYPMALYLLAMLKVRDGDGPQALAFAKDALAFIKKYPEADGRLTTRIFRFKSSDGESWSSADPTIDNLVAELIKSIRENPQTTFKNPYNLL
jgi:hypothetical protein